MAKKRAGILKDENGLLPIAESLFGRIRGQMVCKSCQAKNSYNLDSSQGYRRYRCNKCRALSYGCLSLLKEHQDDDASNALKSKGIDLNNILHAELDVSASLKEDTVNIKTKDELVLENLELKRQIENLETRYGQLERDMKQMTLSLEKLSKTELTELPMAAEQKSSSVGRTRSFAAVVRHGALANEDPEVILALEILHDAKKKQMEEKRKTHDGNITCCSIAKVYICGLPFLRLGDLKSQLYKLRIRLSKIYNVSYIGRSIVEFLVDEEYTAKFKSQMSGFGFEPKDDFNATPQLQAGKPTMDSKRIYEAFRKRLCSIMETTRSPLVKEYLADWLDDFIKNSAVLEPEEPVVKLLKRPRRSTSVDGMNIHGNEC